MKMEELYTKILSIIEGEIAASSYYTWFSKNKPISFDETKSIMKVCVPLGIHRYQLSDRYLKLINDAVDQVYGKTITFEYLTEEEIQNSEPEKELVNETKTENTILLDNWETNLNTKYTFDNYVVGDSNRLAFVSAKSVAEYPGTIHNPLFIYGRSGIGKTHLMHAIGNYIVKNSNLKVLYVTSGDFKEEYVSIFGEKDNNKIETAQKFKNKYQGVDVLIVDDIQYLVGSDKTQQEFFHTFNSLYQKNKQIIISSDRSPDDLQKIEERLKSRFMMGLTVDIYPPELQLRSKIINSKLRGTYLENKLSEDVIEYIANACTTDVRQIEGAINKLMADAALWVPEKIDLTFANESLKNYLKTNIYAENSITKIQRIVAEHFNIEISDLKGKKRTATVARARQIAMYICRVQTDEVLERIGLEFGRDHSTVSAAYNTIVADMKNDIKLNTVIKELISKL